MPDSRSMPTIGPRCHELRIADRGASSEWRIIYRIDADAIVIADAFAKKSRATPKAAISRAVRRFRRYDEALR